MKKFLNLLAITMLLFTSCDKEPIATDEQLSVKALDGEAVFKTLFFYLGDEAKAIPSYKEQIALIEKSQIKDDQFLKIYTASAEAYLEKVKASNPLFITELKNAVQNKDFEQIKASMTYGGNLIMAIATVDALKTIKDTKVASEFAKLNIESYDLTNNKGLASLFQDTDIIMKAGGYDFEAIQSSKNQDIKAVQNFNNLNFNHNLNLNQNLNLNLNQSFAQVFRINFQLDQNFRFNRVINFVKNFNFNLNQNFARIQAFNIITPLGNSANYENYAGEEFIEEIAFAF